MTTYTIERLSRVEDFTDDIDAWLEQVAPKISALFGHVFNHKNFRPHLFAQNGFFLICKRNGKVRGGMVGMLLRSFIDPEIIVLQQVILYVQPDSGRAAYHLFKKFIDIGKTEANHIITMTTSQTNIKGKSLEKLGFKELETLYRLEV